MRMLGELHSESAKITLRLKLTREIIQEALSRLRFKHAEQVNLLSIICGARYKYYYQSILLPTQCPNQHNRARECGVSDSFSYMLRLRAGPEATDSLVMTAKRTLATGRKWAKPRYVEGR